MLRGEGEIPWAAATSHLLLMWDMAREVTLLQPRAFFRHSPAFAAILNFLQQLSLKDAQILGHLSIFQAEMP